MRAKIKATIIIIIIIDVLVGILKKEKAMRMLTKMWGSRRLDNKAIQTYVYYRGMAFFVSTIERDSSAISESMRYNETIVWIWDQITKERKDLIGQYSDMAGSIDTHIRVCRLLHEKGTCE